MQKDIVGPSVRGKYYKKVEGLGRGQYGKVYKVIDESGVAYALKEINIDPTMNNKAIQSLIVEQNIMEMIDHPRILRLHDKIVNDPQCLMLITTYCDGGDLEGLLLKHAKGVGFGEKIAQTYLKEIAEAFVEFAKAKIMHRDLKLANIFLKYGHIVIGDFGFAKLGVSVTDSKLGTPYYMAPEILNSQNKRYSSKCDLWSIGVCFYLLVFGVLPFDAESLSELKSKIEANSGEKLVLPKHQTLSFESKQLLMKLLEKHTDKRISFEEFFAACGVLSQYNMPPRQPLLSNNSSKNSLETRAADDDDVSDDQRLIKSQLQNLGKLSNLNNQLLVPNSNITTTHSRSPRRDLPESNDAKSHEHYGLNRNLGRSNETFLSDTSYENKLFQSEIKLLAGAYSSFSQDPASGYIYPSSGSFLSQLQPYINELNKGIFYLHVFIRFRRCLTTEYPNINAGELSVTLLIMQIFIMRKIDLKMIELAKCISTCSNVFRLEGFESFANSHAFKELYGAVSELSIHVGNAYQSLFTRFQRDNPKNFADFNLYKALPGNQLEPAIKKLTQKLCTIYLSKRKNYYEIECKMFSRGLSGLLYLAKIIPFPGNFSSPDHWVLFSKSLQDLNESQVITIVQSSHIV